MELIITLLVLTLALVIGYPLTTTTLGWILVSHLFLVLISITVAGFKHIWKDTHI